MELEFGLKCGLRAACEGRVMSRVRGILNVKVRIHTACSGGGGSSDERWEWCDSDWCELPTQVVMRRDTWSQMRVNVASRRSLEVRRSRLTSDSFPPPQIYWITGSMYENTKITTWPAPKVTLSFTPLHSTPLFICFEIHHR